MSVNATDAPPPPTVELDNLYPALAECFGIILLGYIAGRLQGGWGVTEHQEEKEGLLLSGYLNS